MHGLLICVLCAGDDRVFAWISLSLYCQICGVDLYRLFTVGMSESLGKKVYDAAHKGRSNDLRRLLDSREGKTLDVDEYRDGEVSKRRMCTSLRWLRG